MGSYGVVYDSANAPIDTHGEMIVPSRRWEVWREGVEDYQYLITLQNQIEQVRTFAPEKADYARHMLERHLDNVLASGTSMEILKARTEITRMVIELEAFER